jgi:hypothetical protein
MTVITATDTEGSGRGIHKDGTTRAVVWTEGPRVGLTSDLRRCQTFLKSDMKTAEAYDWADNKVYTWRSLREVELVITFRKGITAHSEIQTTFRRYRRCHQRARNAFLWLQRHSRPVFTSTAHCGRWHRRT